LRPAVEKEKERREGEDPFLYFYEGEKRTFGEGEKGGKKKISLISASPPKEKKKEGFFFSSGGGEGGQKRERSKKRRGGVFCQRRAWKKKKEKQNNQGKIIGKKEKKNNKGQIKNERPGKKKEKWVADYIENSKKDWGGPRLQGKEGGVASPFKGREKKKRERKDRGSILDEQYKEGKKKKGGKRTSDSYKKRGGRTANYSSWGKRVKKFEKKEKERKRDSF